jgi:hypothetical protein
MNYKPFSIVALTLFSLLFLHNLKAQDFPFEGKLIYHTNDSIQNQIGIITGIDSASYTTYYVKNEWVRIENVTQMGKQIYIKNLAKNKAILLLSFANQHFALTQDLSKDTLVRNYTFKKKCKSIKINSFKGKKGFVSGENLQTPIPIVFSKKHPNYIVDIYNRSIPGLALSYQLIIQGDTVEYELVTLKEGDVSKDLFDIPDYYNVLSMEDFLKRLSEFQNN